MQAVVFQVGAERFAIDSASVTEVIPAVPARRVPASHEALVGVVDYRGHVVPVLDLCRLFGRGDCPRLLSSRILVCNLGARRRRWSDQEDPDLRLGVLAENVTRVATIDPDAPGGHPGPETPGVRGLGRIVRDAHGLLQIVQVRDLVPEDVLRAVTRDGAEEPA
jgi:chemotaxis-related protein WspB